MKTHQKIYLPFKRLIGIFGSIVGIIVCFTLLWWWVIPVNAIVTKGHPFFARHRIGKNGKPFRCLKFRSMKLDANPYMTSRDSNMESQITGFGKFLPNGIICLKGGDLQAEMRPFHNIVELTDISEFFSEDWFKEKHVIYLPI